MSTDGTDINKISPSPHAPIQAPINTTSRIVRIALNPRDHKLRIGIAGATVFLSSSLIPLAGYFGLRYGTTLKVQYILSIITPIFGLVSICAFITRTIRLAKPSSTCRPLGSSSAWTLDYFNWNFAFGLVIVSVIIAIGIALTPSDVRLVSLPLAILLLQVCGQMVVLIPLRAIRARAPVRISSYATGEPLRPACYTIVEDVVAVDGKQGDVFRTQWKARYESSEEFRDLLARLDVLWGVGGLLVAGLVFGVAFGVPSDAAGWAVGWSVPWLWAGVMAAVTVRMAKRICRRENAREAAVGV